MKTYDERVPHAGEDLKRVDLARLNIDRIGLNDGHRVTLDLERVVRVARNRDEADAVAFALGNADDRKRSVRPVAPGVATQPIDQSRIRRPASYCQTHIVPDSGRIRLTGI